MSVPHPTIGPVLIGGSNRSGTTILSLVLQAHPELTGIGSEEAKFHSAFLGPSDDLTPTLADVLEDRATLADFLVAMRGPWWSFATRAGDSRGIHRFASRSALEEALDEFQSSFGKDRWGAGATLLNRLVGGDETNLRWVEASPSNARVASTLWRCFPQMKLVHPVRDGRDVAWSISTQPHWGPDNLDDSLKLWERRIREADEGVRGLPSTQLLYVNFEDLAVHRREPTLDRLLDFLGLDDSPEMRHFFDLHVTVEAAEIDSWRQGLSHEAQERITGEYRQIVDSLRAAGIHAVDHLPSADANMGLRNVPRTPSERRPAGSHVGWLRRQARGDDVLVIGCVDAMTPIQLARRGRSVVGTDGDEAVLAAAGEKRLGEPPDVRDRLRFVQAEGNDLPFPDGSFDSVLLGEATIGRFEPEEILAEARRVARPGGSVAGTVFYTGGEHPDEPYPPDLLGLLDPLARTGKIEALELVGSRLRVVLTTKPKGGRLKRRVLRRAIGIAESRLVEFERSMLEQEARAEALEERLLAREQALQRQLQSRIELTGRLAGEGENLERERERLTRLADDRTEHAAELEGRLRELEGGLREVEGRAERLKVELEEERAAHVRERERAEQLAVERDELVRARDSLATERDRSMEAVEAHRERAEELEGRAEGLQAELVEERGAHVRERERAAQLSAERAELLRERAELVAERDRLATELAEQSARAAELKQRSDLQHARLVSIQESPSYRIMRIGWRIKSFLGRPFSRRRGLPEEGDGSAIEAEADEAGRPRPEPHAIQVSPPAPRPEGSRVARSDGNGDAAIPTVAGVLDTMSRMCLDPECNLVLPSPLDWREQLDVHQPALLLVESAWGGNEGAWQYRIASYRNPDFADLRDLKELIAGCRARGIPTVFWNKEDPVHFERFAAAASLFDAVLTTDVDCVGRYEQLGIERVGVLPFAAQPLLHNPIQRAGARAEVPCFAGSYYRDRHPARQAAQEMLLDAARPHGLVIYDRTHGSADGAFGFPERFQAHVAGGLSYPQVLAAYRRYGTFLNANSVTSSPTMFSRRVFELLACDTPVVSTESVGIEEMFGGAVPIVRTPQEAGDAIVEALTGGETVTRRVTEARLLVFKEHTYRSRLESIAGIAGIEVAGRVRTRPGILLVADDEEGQLRLAAEARAQRLDGSGIGVVCRDGADSVSLIAPLIGRDPVRISAAHDDPLEVVVERAAELMDCDWLAVFRSDCRYGPGHLEDLISCAEYANADAIGSNSANGADPRVRQASADSLHPGSVLVRTEYVRSYGWPLGPDGAAAGSARLFAADGDAFAAPR